MAAAGVRSDITCYLCEKIYTDPVTLLCGHNVCLICIEKAWDITGNIFLDPPSCLECEETYSTRPELRVDKTLGDILEILFPSNPEQEGACLCDYHVRIHSKSTEHIMMDSSVFFNDTVCSTHQKPLGYYCREENVRICVGCVSEHRGHRMKKLKEKPEQIKEKLRILQ
ncbi:hypothetical protein XELAEV_18042949mg, partial [Xenopus laevis]